MLGWKDSKVCLFGANSQDFSLWCVWVCTCVCACVCVSYGAMSQSCHDICQCLRNTTQVASCLVLVPLSSSPVKPHLVLADTHSITMVTSQTVARVTTRCIRVAGIETVDFTSEPRHSPQKVCISSIHPGETNTITKDREGGRGGMKIIACMIKYALHCLFQLC